MISRAAYLMRHGEADASGLLPGRGELQARLAGERLAAVPPAAIWHSPQARAIGTAAQRPGAVPVGMAAELDDYLPSDPDPDPLPPDYARFLAAQPAGGRAGEPGSPHPRWPGSAARLAMPWPRTRVIRGRAAASMSCWEPMASRSAGSYGMRWMLRAGAGSD